MKTHKNAHSRREEPPDFLVQLDNENRDVKTELSELQVHYIEPIIDDDDDDNDGYRCSILRQSTNWRRQEIFCESRFHKRYSSIVECYKILFRQTSMGSKRKRLAFSADGWLLLSRTLKSR